MSLIPISLRDPFFDDPHFSSSRQEFEDMRRQMLTDAKNFWTKLDDDKFERPSLLDRQLSNPATSLPRWLTGRTEDPFFASGDSQVLKVITETVHLN